MGRGRDAAAGPAAYAGPVTDVWGDERVTVRRLALDVLTGLLFAAVTAVVHRGLGPAAVVACVLLGAALAARRVSWRAMAVLALAAAVLQVARGQVAYVADAAYAVLFATLGAHPSALARRLGLSCAAVATAAAGTYAAVRPYPDDGLPHSGGALTVGLAALTAVVTGGGWVVGYLRWQRRRAVQARVDAQLEAAEARRLAELYEVEQERRRIAADMHDVIAHSWAVVAAQSDGARYALPGDVPAAQRSLEVIGETARTAIADLRTIVARLRDPALVPSTPGPAQQAEVVARMRASGMDLRQEVHGTPDDSPLVALTAHRLLGESLTNALRHGDLREPVLVVQDWRDGYRLTVTNLPRSTSHRGTGHGLTGMAERAAVAGGELTAGPEGGRWVVRAHIPRTPAPTGPAASGPSAATVAAADALTTGTDA